MGVFPRWGLAAHATCSRRRGKRRRRDRQYKSMSVGWAEGGKDHVKKGERIEKKERDGDGGKRRLATRTDKNWLVILVFSSDLLKTHEVNRLNS